jgi:hypothetical protein
LNLPPPADRQSVAGVSPKLTAFYASVDRILHEISLVTGELIRIVMARHGLSSDFSEAFWNSFLVPCLTAASELAGCQMNASLTNRLIFDPCTRLRGKPDWMIRYTPHLPSTCSSTELEAHLDAVVCMFLFGVLQNTEKKLSKLSDGDVLDDEEDVDEEDGTSASSPPSAPASTNTGTRRNKSASNSRRGSRTNSPARDKLWLPTLIQHLETLLHPQADSLVLKWLNAAQFEGIRSLEANVRLLRIAPNLEAAGDSKEEENMSSAAMSTESVADTASGHHAAALQSSSDEVDVTDPSRGHASSAPMSAPVPISLRDRVRRIFQSSRASVWLASEHKINKKKFIEFVRVHFGQVSVFVCVCMILIVLQKSS